MIQVISHVVVAVFLLAVAIVVAVTGYWLGDRRVPVVFLSDPIIASGSFRPGGNVIIQSIIDRKRNCYAKIARSFVDASGATFVYDQYDFEAVTKLSPPPRVLREPMTIPLHASVGRGIYSVVIAYGCNPIQRALWPIVIEPTDVVVTVMGEPVAEW